MTEPTTSPRLSFKGYSFWIWLQKNKESLKNLVMAMVALGLFFLPQIEDPALSAGVAAVGAALSKLGLSAIDYFLSDVPIEQKGG